MPRRETAGLSRRASKSVLVPLLAACVGMKIDIYAQFMLVAAKEAFDHLDAPIERVAAQDAPVPFAPKLEGSVIPGEERIEEAIRAAVGG